MRMSNATAEETSLYMTIRHLKYGGHRLEDITLPFICKLALFNTSSRRSLNIFLNTSFSNLYTELLQESRALARSRLRSESGQVRQGWFCQQGVTAVKGLCRQSAYGLINQSTANSAL